MSGQAGWRLLCLTPARGTACTTPAWHYQTMRTQETRRLLYRRPQDATRKDQDLPQQEVNWLMDEDDNETTLLEFVPGSGGRPREWRIRQGNFIEVGSCSSLAATCAVDGTCTARTSPWTSSLRPNAKLMRFASVGRWGLPSR